MLLVANSSISSSRRKRRRAKPFPALLIPLILAILAPTIVTSSGSGSGGGYEDYQSNLPYKHTARCYSCMSKLYEAVWPSLSHIYKRPRNFTDDCDDERISEGRVPVVHCPTICVSLLEQPNIAGVRIKGYIRGCMSDVLISGFNQTIVTWYRWMHRDSCRPYRKKELFKLTGDVADDSTIDVCTCYADHCNGNVSSRISPATVTLTLAVWWLLVFQILL